MTKVDELQKRVETLQSQLRKAGDHLKRLATENGALTEQVERLSASEKTLREQVDNKSDAQELKLECETLRTKIAQLEQQNDEMASNHNKSSSLEQSASKLGEWETAVKDWAMQLGIPAQACDEGVGLSLLDSIKAHVQKPLKQNGTESNHTQLVEELKQLNMDVDSEHTRSKELETQVSQLSEAQDVLSSALCNLQTLDCAPKQITGSLKRGLEQAIAAQQQCAQNQERISELESQLKDSAVKLAEANQAREELNKDYDLLLERISTMKDALKAKMNAESDELKRLRKEVASTKSAAASSKAQYEKAAKRLESANQALQKELDETKRQLWDAQELAGRAEIELRDLGGETDRQMSDLKARLQAAEERLRSESAQSEQLEGRVEQLQRDLDEALNAESQWVSEKEVHLVTIQNLQSALENLQESKDSEIDMAIERLREDLRARTKETQAAVARAEAAEARLRKIELSGTSPEQSQQRINSLAVENEGLRHEVAVLKDHLNESMRRLREESSEFNLDKRVITNLIVGFLALPYGDSKRFEILQLMSSILQFSEEQQQKVGLIRKVGRRTPWQNLSQPGTPAPEPAEPSAPNMETKDSFSDQWISYLLRESSKTRNRGQ
ncbi:hypothetical protein GGI07_003616 [Coemansia sp. Benny D115]|nr:hypothetical protein GGI07_003616 [Coemansia sp. Benny D115]